MNLYIFFFFVIDGESLNSVDQEIEKELEGTDDIRYGDMTFEHITKRKSLLDMLRIFEDGFDITKTTFFIDYPKFYKIFNQKTIKALQLLSHTIQYGFADENDVKTSSFGIYDPKMYKLMEKRIPKDIPIDADQHPVLLFVFVVYIKST